MGDSYTAKAFKLATASARFAFKQTQTNIQLARDLRDNIQAYQPLLQQAAQDTLGNVASVLVAAERSLPADMENLTPGEREREITESLTRGERHLLSAVGELYRSYRLVTSTEGVIIDNPSQYELNKPETSGDNS